MVDFYNLASDTLDDVLKTDIRVVFDSKSNEFKYQTDSEIIVLPANFKIREINRHHICWIKRYGLNLSKYTDTDLLIAYYIFCICHEYGHHVHRIMDMDSKYREYVAYAEYIAEDWDMYRNILTEQLADEYACMIFTAREKEIDDLIKKYNF